MRKGGGVRGSLVAKVASLAAEKPRQQPASPALRPVQPGPPLTVSPGLRVVQPRQVRRPLPRDPLVLGPTPATTGEWRGVGERPSVPFEPLPGPPRPPLSTAPVRPSLGLGLAPVAPGPLPGPHPPRMGHRAPGRSPTRPYGPPGSVEDPRAGGPLRRGRFLRWSPVTSEDGPGVRDGHNFRDP